LEESLLQHVGSDFWPPRDTQCNAVEPARFDVVEPL